MRGLEKILETEEIVEGRSHHRRRFCASVNKVILINSLLNKKVGIDEIQNAGETEDAEAARRRSRLVSVENTTLTEVITAYEKLKKGRDTSKVTPFTRIEVDFNEAEETVPKFNIPLDKSNFTGPGLEFNTFKQFRPSKYLYFSQATKLIQAESLELLASNFPELLRSKNYWLNIFNPNEQDFSILFNSYGVHDITISDIREGNTEEKLEVYKHYTFFSLRLITSENKNSEKIKNEDVDFNILLFKDFIITLHDKEWSSGIKDILEFLNLLSTNSQNLFKSDWVLFSCFIEMNQDAKCMLDLIEPEINNIRVESKSVDLQNIVIMKRNFDMELQLYTISRFIKPKMKILRLVKVKCSKRLDPIVMRLLGEILEDFRELNHDLHHFNHILERSQDTFLALVSSDQSRDSNEMSRVMKRISELALVSIPIQAIGGLFGMNVTVPFQGDPNLVYFFCIVGGCFLLSTLLYCFRKCILRS